MCQHEEAYVLPQIRAQSIIDSPEILNTHGIAKPALPHTTYEMLADDSFMATKMDKMVVGGGAQACVNLLSAQSTEWVQISMFDHIMWSGARLPLNMQERWKWVLTHYDIEHSLWK